MKMKITNREEFLLDMYAYLRNGSDRDFDISGLRVPRTDKEAREVLFDRDKLMEVDIFHDELSYYDLNFDDFEWEADDDDFELVSKDDFDKTIQLIIDEKHDEYSGYVQTNSVDEFDFEYAFSHNITDGKRFAMLNMD